MSCNETKLVFRAEIPHLNGKNKNDVLAYFREKIGEPSEVDEWDGVVEWFDYKGQFQPVHDYDTGRWGIDLVIHHESDYKVYIPSDESGISFKNFKEKAKLLANKFGVDKNNVKLFSYTWYNSGDEPITFE